MTNEIFHFSPLLYSLPPPPPLLVTKQAPLSDITFKAASFDWVQDTVAATTRWGDLGDWDVSGVGDFTRAFCECRTADGSHTNGANLKAATFVGTGMSKWITTSLTKMEWTFRGAAAMNADLTSWSVVKVTTMEGAFSSANKFAGKGLDSWITSSIAGTALHFTFSTAREMNADLSGWNVAKVKTFLNLFDGAAKFTGTGLYKWRVPEATDMKDMFRSTVLTSCNKRKIADAWKGNNAFKYTSAWAGETCTVR